MNFVMSTIVNRMKHLQLIYLESIKSYEGFDIKNNANAGYSYS